MVSLYLCTFALTYHGWEVARKLRARDSFVGGKFGSCFWERCVSLSEANLNELSIVYHIIRKLAHNLTSCQPIIDGAALREVYFVRASPELWLSLITRRANCLDYTLLSGRFLGSYIVPTNHWRHSITRSVFCEGFARTVIIIDYTSCQLSGLHLLSDRFLGSYIVPTNHWRRSISTRSVFCEGSDYLTPKTLLWGVAHARRIVLLAASLEVAFERCVSLSDNFDARRFSYAWIRLSRARARYFSTFVTE